MDNNNKDDIEDVDGDNYNEYFKNDNKNYNNYDNNDNYYVTGTLKNNKLIIEESDNINLKGWELPRID